MVLNNSKERSWQITYKFQPILASFKTQGATKEILEYNQSTISQELNPCGYETSGLINKQ